MNEKIIIAPATAAGIAGVSMIRVSGFGCINLVDQIFKGSYSLKSKKANEIAYGRLVEFNTKRLIDEVLIGIFHAPNSFTGEESLEIWTHGSPYIVKELLKILTNLGATIAAPGEFSMRAFLNGKIDLTQAEAIKDLTEAQTKFAHTQALNRLEGGLSSKIQNIHNDMLNLLALLETAIDHAEEEVDIQLEVPYKKLITQLICEIEQLLSTAKVGKMSVDGIKVVIIGKPNVGKSSLLNALMNEDRVIVSPIAGTTRDVIEDRISARGLMIRFFDTAGLRKTGDMIEKQGTERTLKVIAMADIILHIMDQSIPLEQEDQEILDYLQNTNKFIVTLFNKSDLPNMLKFESPYKSLSISTKNNQGLELIFDEISNFYHSGGIDPENDTLIANIRQENLLIYVIDFLQKAKTALLEAESEEFVAAHVRNARITLEEIVGKTTDDAILERIFSQFCIGK